MFEKARNIFIDIKKFKCFFRLGCAKQEIVKFFLKKTLDNIEHYSSLFKESFKVIIENGSKDKTRDILKKIKLKMIFIFLRII